MYTAYGAAGANCGIETFEFILDSASASIYKQNMNMTVSNLGFVH